MASTRGLVIDADGLNALSGEAVWGEIGTPFVLTPHPGEMARLIETESGAVQADRLGVALGQAAAWDGHVVLKGANTIVAAPDGRASVSAIANAALATAGFRRCAGGDHRRFAGPRPRSVRGGDAGGLPARQCGRARRAQRGYRGDDGTGHPGARVVGGAVAGGRRAGRRGIERRPDGWSWWWRDGWGHGSGASDGSGGPAGAGEWPLRGRGRPARLARVGGRRIARGDTISPRIAVIYSSRFVHLTALKRS